VGALTIAALVSGLVCALAPLAQAARIVRTGSAHDVSLIWLCLYAVGSAVWISYGAAIGSLPLIVSQSTALLCVAVTLSLAARHRRADGGPRSASTHPAVERAPSGLGRGPRSAPQPGRAPRTPPAQPLTTPSGISRATGAAIPTRSTTDTTRSTSL
jgi:MtN3 and saliva related transmembrane protein